MFTMIVGTMSFGAVVTMSTRVNLIVFRVVFLLLPAMTVGTLVLIGASILIAANIRPGSPIRTLLFGVLVELGLPSEVLPIMSKHA